MNNDNDDVREENRAATAYTISAGKRLTLATVQTQEYPSENTKFSTCHQRVKVGNGGPK